MAERLRNRDRSPKQYAVATATNGVLTSGGRTIGKISTTAQGRYVIVKTGAGFTAIKSGT